MDNEFQATVLNILGSDCFSNYKKWYKWLNYEYVCFVNSNGIALLNILAQKWMFSGILETRISQKFSQQILRLLNLVHWPWFDLYNRRCFWNASKQKIISFTLISNLLNQIPAQINYNLIQYIIVATWDV